MGAVAHDRLPVRAAGADRVARGGGESNRAIGDTVGMHYNQVGVWRSRFTEFGMDELFDEDRPGRPPVYTHDDVIRLVSLITELPPDDATRWTMEALVDRMHAHGCAISASQVWRTCHALDLKPWQTQSWMTSGVTQCNSAFDIRFVGGAADAGRHCKCALGIS